MTSVATNNSWEVAGKRTLRKNGTNGTVLSEVNGQIKKKTATNGTLKKDKIPTIETMAPLKTDMNIYNAFRDSEDDGYGDEDSENRAPKRTTRQHTANSRKENGTTNKTIVLTSSFSSASPTASPILGEGKRKQNKRKSGEEPLNLVSASQMTTSTLKKKPTTNTSSESAAKIENDLNVALSRLQLNEFETELGKLKALFPNSYVLIIENLVAFLNTKLQSIPDLDVFVENKPGNPRNYLVKLDLKLEKFFANLISKCSANDQYKLFESSFHVLLNEPVKPSSSHGYKLFVQMLVKLAPNAIMFNLNELRDSINNSKHRHQRCVIAMWALGQYGYMDLANGVSIWFETMLPFIQVKNLTKFVIWYLNSLFEYHKITTKTALNVTTSAVRQSKGSVNNSIQEISNPIISIDQYFKMFELVGDKQQQNQLINNKEYQAKLNMSYEIVKVLFSQEINQNGEFYFEELLSNMESTNKTKEAELMELTGRCLLASHNKNILNKWKKIFPKYQKQSFMLLDYLTKTNSKCFKSMSGLNELVFYFDSQLSTKLAQMTAPKETATSPNSKHYYINKRSQNKPSSWQASELQMLQSNNQLVKQIIRQHYQRSSKLTMILRTTFYIILALSIFFIWDSNKNQSIYTNSAKKELQKYGLLEPVQNLTNSIHKVYLNLQSTFNVYFPIWYRKAYHTVVPLAKTCWSTTCDYASLAWSKSEPLRLQMANYVNYTIEYISVNFPVVAKNIQSSFELVINYFTTMSNLVIVYAGYATDYIGTNLLGWKKGQLEQVFLDAFKLFLAQVTRFFEWLDTLSKEPVVRQKAKVVVN